MQEISQITISSEKPIGCWIADWPSKISFTEREEKIRRIFRTAFVVSEAAGNILFCSYMDSDRIAAELKLAVDELRDVRKLTLRIPIPLSVPTSECTFLPKLVVKRSSLKETTSIVKQLTKGSPNFCYTI